MTTETKEIFIVYTNTDLTEGRGHQVPIHYCDTQATALRFSRKRGVMGSDASVEQSQAIKHNGSWCAPVKFEQTSADDLDAQKRMDAKDEAIAKAKAAGLSDSDLAALGIK